MQCSNSASYVVLTSQGRAYSSVYHPCTGEPGTVDDAVRVLGDVLGLNETDPPEGSVPAFIPEAMQFSLIERVIPMSSRGRQLMHDALEECLNRLGDELEQMQFPPSPRRTPHETRGPASSASGYAATSSGATSSTASSALSARPRTPSTRPTPSLSPTVPRPRSRTPPRANREPLVAGAHAAQIHRRIMPRRSHS